jgi:hypothetical protein
LIGARVTFSSAVRCGKRLKCDHPDLLAQSIDVSVRIVNRGPVHLDLPGLDRLQSIDAADQGGLPTSAGSSHDHYRSAGNVQANVLEDVELPEPLVDLLQPDHCRRHSKQPAGGSKHSL